MTTDIKQNTLSLEKMNNKEFDKFLKWSIENYAEAKIKAGNWTKDEALENSIKAYEGYLPQGLKTENHYLYSIVNKDSERIGHLWYLVENDVCFIYDFLVYENYRRQGFAIKCLEILEKEIATKNWHYIRLHVFGHNKPAIKLYEKCGYVKELRSTEQNIFMRKTLK